MTKVTVKSKILVVPTKTGNCYSWQKLHVGDSIVYNDYDISDTVIKNFLKKFDKQVNIEKDPEVTLNSKAPKPEPAKVTEVVKEPVPEPDPVVVETETDVDVSAKADVDTVEDEADPVETEDEE